MIDIQLLRKDPAEVARRLAVRGAAFEVEQYEGEERNAVASKTMIDAVEKLSKPFPFVPWIYSINGPLCLRRVAQRGNVGHSVGEGYWHAALGWADSVALGGGVLLGAARHCDADPQ